MIPAWLTWQAISLIGGKLWKGFCDFISTPVGAALVAGFCLFWIGVWHEHGNLVEAVKAKDAAWQRKWDDAEKQAELDRQKRDALVQADMQAKADKSLSEVSSRKDQLEQMVKDYEDQQLLQAATGKPACPPEYTDDSDARWLRDIERHKDAKSKAGSRPALRMRTIDR
ncbi:hypothetical protein EIA17_24645 [Escherichia coli]|nr:hypothetical protein EIA17_24645 [Escherichia coli]